MEGINFTLNQGEHLSVMGESGCGKSTLLKLVYGLLDADQGTMYWKGQPIQGPAFHLVPGMDFFKYVAQDFDLMPFTSVADNISKFLPRTEPEESERRTMELLEVIEMTDQAEVMVKTLSGGQKQRVAIARALALEPELLLLDEPFGQIDNFKKTSLRRMLFSYLKKKNIACIVATHDTHDALSFADEMMVIRGGRIVATGDPKTLFRDPPSKYVATLFDDVNEIELSGKRRLLYPHQVQITDAFTHETGVSGHGTDTSAHRAIVVNAFFKGSFWLIEIQFQEQLIYVRHDREMKSGDQVFLSF